MAEPRRAVRRAGTGDRATVALVYREVAHLREVSEIHLGSINEKLDKLDGLPDRVTRLEGRVTFLEDDDKADDESGRFWQRLVITTAVSAVLSAPGWVAFLTN